MLLQRVLRTAISAGLLLFCAACGNVGAPLPPSLELPQRTTDLRAQRVGDRVVLTFTVPGQTTDRTTLRRLGMTRVCRGIQLSPETHCETLVAEIEPGAVPADRKVRIEDRLPATDPTGFAGYSVEILNFRGRGAGLSKPVWVPLAPTPSTSTGLRATVTAEALVLNWEPAAAEAPAGLRFAQRLYRRADAGEWVPVGELPIQASEFRDNGFEWEKAYTYQLVPFTVVPSREGAPIEVRGEPSQPLQVVARDTFPPAVPASVQAVFSPQQGFTDLTWSPNAEEDLAGYHVLRSEAVGDQPAGAPRQLTAQPVSTPSFRDTNVRPGVTYFYRVRAVDLRGNQSGESEPAREAVPAQ